MRGEVLHYDTTQGFGFISGADGNRYTFERRDLRRDAPVSKGTSVEFNPDGASARDIFLLHGIPAPQVMAAPSAVQPAQFGRVAADHPSETTGLWSYFWRVLTQDYANFRGRARRKEYWGFYLFWIVLLIVASLAGVAIDAALGNLDPGSEMPVATMTLTGGLVLASIIPYFALMVRRQHDIGLSGWFLLLLLLPYIGGLILFVFTLIPSQKHDNKWGPVPAGVRF